jgi:DNA primase
LRFSQDFIEKVRDANNIVDVFAEYTQLKRNGTRLMGLCPFPGHNEKTPSFSVSEDKQVYHCFGCHRSGNIYKAVEELKGFSFPDAVEYLAKKAGLPIPADAQARPEEQKAKSHREVLLKINASAANYYHMQFQNAAKNHIIRTYAEKRGLTAEIIELFKIGYATELWDGLAKNLSQMHAPLPDAAELGLIRKRKEGDGYFDFFRHRLIFPIVSHKGEYVGFGGRSLSAEDQPKYRNSAESAVFIKGQTFYGLNETAKYIRSEGYAIIVEGYMDFLALFAVGIKNVVATLGTALTPTHAHLLKRYTTNVVALFDGDSAGQTAARRSLPILLAEELLVRGVTLPDELDPDDFIKERGAETLKKILHSAPDLFSLMLDSELTGFRGAAADKVRVLNAVGPLLNEMKDARLQELYVNEAAQKMGVEAAWVRRHMGTNVGSTTTTRAKVAENRPPLPPQLPKDVMGMPAVVPLKGSPQAELFLLNISLMSPERFNSIWQSAVVAELSHSGVRELFMKADTFYRQMPSEFAKLSAYLMSVTDAPHSLGLHLGEPLSQMGAEELDKFTDDCIRQVRHKFLRNKSRELAATLQSSSSEEQKQDKLREIMSLQKSKQTLRRDREI